MRVLPIDAVGHLVHDGGAEAGGAGGERGEDDGGGGGGGRVGPRPVRVAEPGDAAGDVEDVLDGEGEAVERELLRWRRRQHEPLHEGAEVFCHGVATRHSHSAATASITWSSTPPLLNLLRRQSGWAWAK